ncbi:glycosyltransferase family 2 protein [Litoribacter ruber]|uniref:glycosyltransferase family 2 protein n=1 Tax=Litoribacter ruber TaxID=702568 RepID=UPI001BD9C620|nr:glycosyltransferase family 2 protein [Litoribacter ruber]MBT0812289.1 glycosyltransferase family 2 protein [Litoribacter ruber]
MEPLDITIVIPVKNEEKLIGDCLKSVGTDFCKKIIVIDSSSTDRTCEIAERLGAEVINFKWDGKFPKKRNWFLRNHTPTTKWVLFLDADEFLTEGFKKELRSKIQKDSYVGFWLSYSIYFAGKKLRGGYPLQKLALFQVGAGEYERIKEQHWSKLDMEIHEHPIVEGKVGKIKSKIDHRDFRSIEHYIQKQREYAKWESYRYLDLNPKSRLLLTAKQKLKYRLLTSPWVGPLYFLGSFIFLGGFRDGYTGLTFAFLKMAYFNEIYCRIKELKSSCPSHLIPGQITGLKSKSSQKIKSRFPYLKRNTSAKIFPN